MPDVLHGNGKLDLQVCFAARSRLQDDFVNDFVSRGMANKGQGEQQPKKKQHKFIAGHYGYARSMKSGSPPGWPVIPFSMPQSQLE